MLLPIVQGEKEQVVVKVKYIIINHFNNNRYHFFDEHSSYLTEFDVDTIKLFQQDFDLKPTGTITAELLTFLQIGYYDGGKARDDKQDMILSTMRVSTIVYSIFAGVTIAGLLIAISLMIYLLI